MKPNDWKAERLYCKPVNNQNEWYDHARWALSSGARDITVTFQGAGKSEVEAASSEYGSLFIEFTSDGSRFNMTLHNVPRATVSSFLGGIARDLAANN